MENERIKILFERQKEQSRFRNTNFKPIPTAVSRNWMELLSLNEERLIIFLQVMNNSDEIIYFFQNKIGIFVKLISKVFMRWKNCREFKSYETMNLREEDWSKIRTPFMNSRPEFRNYRMKLIVWMIREFFKMLDQYVVDYLTFPVNQRYSHFFAILAGCWAAKISRQTFWDTHGCIGKRFFFL